MSEFFQYLAMFIGLVVTIIAFSLLFAIPVWLLWNYALVGAIAGVNQIGLFQAWGISCLCNILFKHTSKTKK